MFVGVLAHTPPSLIYTKGIITLIGNLYIIRNNTNDKVYIGKCYYGLKSRLRDHITKAKRNLDKYKDGNYRLHSAMREIGYDNFTIELLGRFKQGLLEEKEIEYIAKFDALNSGYNLSNGGDNPSTLTNETEKRVLLQFCVEKLPINTISENLGISGHLIRNILNSRYIFPEHLQAVKPKTWIAKIDMATGEWLGLYSSTAEAALSVGNRRCDSHIIHCCQGKRKTAYGFSWAYA